MGVHHFGEVVIIPKTGVKATIGVPRNDMARIVGFGDVKNGGWLVQKVGDKCFRPVVRRNPMSVNSFTMAQLTEETGQQWMPVREGDGTVRFRSRVLDIPETHEWSDNDGLDNLRDTVGMEWSSVSFEKPVAITTDKRVVLVCCGGQSEDEGSSDGEDSQDSTNKVVIQHDYVCEEGENDNDTEWEQFYQRDGDNETCVVLAANAVVALAAAGTTPVFDGGENPTFRQTLRRADAQLWQEARKKEMDTHAQRGTMVPASVPAGVRPLPTKWVHTIKRDGTYKARIVVCGNFDPFRGETYAPTALKSVMWLILAIVVVLGLQVRVFDISAAFVAEDITRTVYVLIDGASFRLQKFLYGLVDAPRGFNLGMADHLLKGGYVRSMYDRCLFYKWIAHDDFVVILVHVDDFYVAGTSISRVDDFGKWLRENYDMKAKEGTESLGMQIPTLADGSKVFTKQLRKIVTNYAK